MQNIYHFWFFFIILASLFSTSASRANIFFNFSFGTGGGLSGFSSASILISSSLLMLFYVLMSMSTPTISSVKITPKLFLLIQGASGLGYAELMPISSMILGSTSNLISGGYTLGRQNDNRSLTFLFSLYSTSGKIEQSLFVKGKGVKSRGSLDGNSPNSS